MKISWLDFAKLHAPYIVMGICVIISTIYACGYENGKRAILDAAANSMKEVR